MRLSRRTTVLAAAILSGALIAPAAAAADPSPEDGGRHVLLLSVDGLHQADLSWYVAHHPKSALAALVNRGVDFTHASTPVPSDSFPGMIAQATGGNPDTTGVYYDSTYNHALLPAGTTTCPAGAPTGADVEYAENLDRNPNSIDAG
jgi:Type I phosphodiesterase / nucleotide pyrophosphatase